MLGLCGGRRQAAATAFAPVLREKTPGRGKPVEAGPTLPKLMNLSSDKRILTAMLRRNKR